MIDLDEALERFQIGGFEYGNRIPNYGPMAAEALVALGHSVLITGLVDQYAPRLPQRGSGRALSSEGEKAALGRPDRAGDWLATYEERLRREPWPKLVAREVERLAGGVSAASVHGLIRLAHGVRALGREETPIRMRELAFGLAYWAANHDASPEEASREAETAALVGPDGVDVGGRITVLCRDGAQRYLAHLEDRAAFTLFTTAPAAIRLLSPVVEDAILCRLLEGLSRFGVNGSGAPTAGGGDPADDPEVTGCAESRDETRYRAACSLQEHAISFAEACLREDAQAPDPGLRLAAADAALRLSPVGYQALR